MILFVDNEHKWGYQQSWGEFVLAARTRITYRLEDITGDTCLLQRYPRVGQELIERYSIRAMFISGSGTHKDDYEEAEQEGLREVIRRSEIPIFGFCGGFQLLAETLGAPLERIGPIPDGEEDPDPDYEPGLLKEVGYLPVDVESAHPIAEGLGGSPIFRQHHNWEIKQLPPGFVNHASSRITPNQMVVHETLPIMGTQFHPEYYTDEHPAGRVLIENFCRWSNLI